MKQASTQSSVSNYIGILALLSAYALGKGLTLSSPFLTYEEGHTLQTAFLLGVGHHQAYTEVFSFESPLFLWFLAQFGGEYGRYGYKLFYLGLSLILLGGTTYLSHAFGGRRVALATLFLLATSVAFLVQSTTIVALVPALCLAVVSLLCLIGYLKTGSWGWLMLSGFLGGMALQFSLAVLATGLFAPILSVSVYVDSKTQTLTWLQSGPSTQNRAKTLLWWGLAWAIALSLGLLCFGSDAVFGIYLAQLGQIRQSIPLSQSENFQAIGSFLFFNLPLAGFFVIGLRALYPQKGHSLWLVFIWFLLNVAWLMVQVPLAQAQLLVLALPMALIAGYGLVYVWDWLSALDVSSRGQMGLKVGLVALLLLTAAQQSRAFVFQGIETPNDWAKYTQRPQVVAFIQSQTRATDCVYIDDPTLAVLAQRWPPPPLASLSMLKVKSGFIDEAQIQRILQVENCSLALFSRRDYHREVQGLRDWASDYYSANESFGNTRIYFNPLP